MGPEAGMGWYCAADKVDDRGGEYSLIARRGFWDDAIDGWLKLIADRGDDDPLVAMTVGRTVEPEVLGELLPENETCG